MPNGLAAHSELRVLALRRSSKPECEFMAAKAASPTKAVAKTAKASKAPAKATAASKKRVVSDSQKEAMAVGRDQGRLVRRYLDALDAHKPKRGRKRSTDTIKNRLAEIDAKLSSASSFDKAHMAQERMNLMRELTTVTIKVDLTSLEGDFVQVAGEYSNRRGISYAAWREAGVDAAVLKKANIKRAGV